MPTKLVAPLIFLFLASHNHRLIIQRYTCSNNYQYINLDLVLSVCSLSPPKPAGAGLDPQKILQADFEIRFLPASTRSVPPGIHFALLLGGLYSNLPVFQPTVDKT
jgi:hypothetical protein